MVVVNFDQDNGFDVLSSIALAIANCLLGEGFGNLAVSLVGIMTVITLGACMISIGRFSCSLCLHICTCFSSFTHF